jgi:hypothetical protein
MVRPRPRPLLTLARRIVELMELLENRLKLLFGNADPGIPDLDAQLVAAPPAAEQDLPLLVYFTAFESRLRIICSSKRGSLRTLRLLGTTRQPSRCAAA